MEERLLEDDGAGDVLLQAGRREEDLAVLAAVLLAVLNACGLVRGRKRSGWRGGQISASECSRAQEGGGRMTMETRRRDEPIDSKRFPMVPADSSAARMPLPGAPIARCSDDRRRHGEGDWVEKQALPRKRARYRFGAFARTHRSCNELSGIRSGGHLGLFVQLYKNRVNETY